MKGQLRAATTLHPKQRLQLPVVRAWASRSGPYVQTKNLFPLSVIETHRVVTILTTPSRLPVSKCTICFPISYNFSSQYSVK